MRAGQCCACHHSAEGTAVSYVQKDHVEAESWGSVAVVVAGAV